MLPLANIVTETILNSLMAEDLYIIKQMHAALCINHNMTTKMNVVYSLKDKELKFFILSRLVPKSSADSNKY